MASRRRGRREMAMFTAPGDAQCTRELCEPCWRWKSRMASCSIKGSRWPRFSYRSGTALACVATSTPAAREVSRAAWQTAVTHFTMTTRAALLEAVCKATFTAGILKISKWSLLRVFGKTHLEVSPKADILWQQWNGWKRKMCKKSRPEVSPVFETISKAIHFMLSSANSFVINVFFIKVKW